MRLGMLAGFSAWENHLLGSAGGVVLKPRTARAVCAEAMAAYDIRPPDPGLAAAAFSGGNQQKLVLAREIGRNPELLLVGQPTRGVDIGAVEFIHRQLLELRRRGKAILLVSAELDEIIGLSDRILVMFEGRVVGEFPAGTADERAIGRLMSGLGDKLSKDINCLCS